MYSALFQSLLIDGEVSCINSNISSESINCKMPLRLGLVLFTCLGLGPDAFTHGLDLDLLSNFKILPSFSG